MPAPKPVPFGGACGNSGDEKEGKGTPSFILFKSLQHFKV